ncbi:MAG: glycosyltransferase family 87 protein [Vulcanimicrobiaceae bacterium]
MTLHRWALAGVIAVLLGVPLALQTSAVGSNGYLAGDFRAFYCAARVAREHGDPYLAAPLYRCEISVGPGKFVARHPDVTVPAPLPGYALAMIAPLARLPFALAAAIWMAVALAAFAVCIIVLKRLSGFALSAIVAALALSMGMTSLPFGENIPFAIGALCLCAWFASQGRWRAASVAAAVAMIEPQLGLPACLALFVWVKQSRVVLAVTALLFALVSLWFIGPAANVEYFARVLPAQALSEASRDTQYSLSSVLIGFGIGDSVATRIAEIEYVLMVVLGLVAGRLLARRYTDDALLVLIPLAFAVMGGSYVHITQIAAAIPAAIILLRHVKQHRAILLAGLVLLAVPWLHAPFAVTACAAPVALLVWQLGGRNACATLASAFLAAAMLLGLSWMAIASKPDPSPRVVARAIDRDLPQASWSRFTQQENSTGSIASWAERFPTWTGLLLLAFGALYESKVLDRRRAVMNVRQATPPEGVTAQ